MNYWDKVYDGPDRYFNKFNEKINDFIEDGESLLDFGCGEGHFNKYVNPNVHYSGIDYSSIAIEKARQTYPDKDFYLGDIRNLSTFEDNKFDTVFLYECYENLPNWKESLKELWRIARKRVFIIMRGNFSRGTSCDEIDGDTFHQHIDYSDFDHEARTLTTAVSYNFDWDNHVVILLNKKMNNIIFTLDDFKEDNHRLDLLQAIKEQSPGMKVTLFTEPAHCSYEWLKGIKEKYDWVEFAIHGWEHDVYREQYKRLYPNECEDWTYERTIKCLDDVEKKFPGIFVKGFKAPGWQINDEVYRALEDRGYWVMNHYIHHIPETGRFYTTNHLWEYNGHIQDTPYNGLENLYNNKNVFLPDSKYYFVSEMIDDKNILNKRLENL